MAKKSKRYYGMTISQIGILGGMAAMICILGAVFLFMLMLPPSQAQQSVRTVLPPTLSFTSTPQFQTSPSQTPTPTLSGAVVATSAPPEGWVEFQTQGAMLWLPANFVGGDLVSNKPDTYAKMVRLGNLYKNTANAVKDAGPEYVLWMVDKSIRSQTDVIPTVNVQRIIQTEEISLDDYLDEYLTNGNIEGTPVAMMLTINETKRLNMLGREAKRLTTSTSYAGHEATGLTYYIKDGMEIWVITYYVSPNAYFDMLPTIEQSFQTFNLVK